jgi:hypothetical protein
MPLHFHFSSFFCLQAAEALGAIAESSVEKTLTSFADDTDVIVKYVFIALSAFLRVVVVVVVSKSDWCRCSVSVSD